MAGPACARRSAAGSAIAPRSRPSPSQGSSNRLRLRLGVGDARRRRRARATPPRRPWRPCASTSSPARGLIWMVTSRDMSPRQACEASPTRIAPPAVRQARNVMIAITTTSARPAIELGGHQRHVALELRHPPDAAPRASGGRSSRFALEDSQPSVADDQAAGVAELVHQRQIVGGDDHGGAGLVQFDEQPQQPPRQARDRRCRSARPRAAVRAARSARARSPRAAFRRPTAPAAARSSVRRGRPSAAVRRLRRDSRPRRGPSRAAAARRSRRSSDGRAGGNPGTRRRCAAAAR